MPAFFIIYFILVGNKIIKINETVSQNPLEYIRITESLDIDGQPIVAGSAYYTHWYQY